MPSLIRAVLGLCWFCYWHDALYQVTTQRVFLRIFANLPTTTLTSKWIPNTTLSLLGLSFVPQDSQLAQSVNSCVTQSFHGFIAWSPVFPPLTRIAKPAAEAMNHQYTAEGKEKKLGDDWQKDRTASGSLHTKGVCFPWEVPLFLGGVVMVTWPMAKL